MHKNISFRSAALIVKDKKLLFAKHINHPCYYLVGGGVEEGEASKTAVIREIYEEIGLTLEVDKLVMIQERFHKVNEQRHHEVVFLYLIKNCDDINILDGTFSDQGTKETLHWLPIDKLSEFEIVPEFLKSKSFEDMNYIEHVVIKEY